MHTGRQLRPVVDIRYVLMMPSFYGGTVWIATLTLYWMGLLDWNTDSDISICVFLGVAVSFLCSFFLFRPSYLQFSRDDGDAMYQAVPGRASVEPMPRWLLLFHMLGVLGIAVYVYDMSLYFGSVSVFLSVLQDSSHLIRWASAEITSSGTQIAYFGWGAAATTSYRCFCGKLDKKWMLLVLLQIAGNALWIDRTRPTTIIFLCCLMYTLSRRKLALSQVILHNGLLLIVAIGLFIGIGVWVGKLELTTSGSSDTAALTNIYFYLTSSYAFCNDVLTNDVPINGSAYTFTPLCKVLATFGFIDKAPDLILDFRSVPYATNVGTFLVSFYWDGGWAYLLFGIFLYSFGLDYVGWRLLCARNDLANLGWGAACWIACMAFFTTKIASTEMWLFFALTMPGLWMSQRHRHYAPYSVHVA